MDFIIEEPDRAYNDSIEVADASQTGQDEISAFNPDRVESQHVAAIVQSSPIPDTSFHGASASYSSRFPFSPSTSAIAHERTFLSSEREVHLMRHWIDNVSHYFDYFDQERHFAIDVPQRAKGNEVLCVAILALSARHLNLTQGSDSYTADKYLERCVSLLIPQMADPKAAADDAFFAAVVILRFLEELDVSVSGYDSEGHIVGTRAAMNAIQQQPVPLYGLRRACYWVAYRQEIQNSILTQRPLQWHLPDYNDLADPPEDFTWALRANELLANAADVVFESEPPSPERITRVQNSLDTWTRNRPASFDELWTQPASYGGTFDRTYYHNTYHVMAHCYHTQAHMLVAAYAPPSMDGFESDEMEKSKIILEDIKRICGMTLANPQGPGSWERAALAIELFGDRFYLQQDRENILQFLTEVERKCAWMSSGTRWRLRRVWNMN